MKRLLSYCFLLFFISQLNAQISVVSFNPLPMELDARVSAPKKDQDGNLCAIIKVVTTQTGFRFDFGISGVVDKVQKPSEIWLYVPYGVKRLTISHEIFGLLRNYEIPVPIEKAKVYELVLAVGKVTTTVTGPESVWLTLRSTPDGADAYVDDILKGATPRAVKLLPGKHSYRIEKALHHTDNGEIVITGQEKDGKKDLTVTLRPAFGTIKFSTQPELGATVLVNNEETGKTTPFSMKLKSGTHTITFKKENYQPRSFELTVKDGDVIEKSEKLFSNAANVTITAQNDADIYVDGKYVGKGSYQGVISAGVVTFEAKKEGYYSDKKEKDIAINEVNTINLSPQPMVGSVEVLSEPIDATVFLNGLEKGTTPITLRNLMIGKYELKLEKEGYYASLIDLSILENKIMEVNKKLQSVHTPVIPSVATEKKQKLDEQEQSIDPKTTNKETTTIDNTISDIEGNSYLTVTIDKQVWMASNLKTTKYNDGSAIPLVADNAAWSKLTTPGYCWYKNDPINKRTYGALYNWYTINTAKLCPIGWHIPTNSEWFILLGFLGTDAGGKMKEKGIGHWSSPNRGATNETGFLALPGGYRHDEGAYYNFVFDGFWWSSTETSTDYAWGKSMSYLDSFVYNGNYFKRNGFSVRCLKDY
jgi:uncharacterized protein (TIGR02145 family)